MTAIPGVWESHYIPRRRIPLYYTNGSILVLGSYDNPITGGCDGICKPPIVAYCGKDGVEAQCLIINNLIRELRPDLVLCEGLLLSEDVKWSLTIPSLQCLFLTTPNQQCQKRVTARRLLSGRTEQGITVDKKPGKTGKRKPTTAERIELRSRTIERARIKLITAGVECRRCSSDQAPGIILRWIRDVV